MTIFTDYKNYQYVRVELRWDPYDLLKFTPTRGAFIVTRYFNETMPAFQERINDRIEIWKKYCDEDNGKVTYSIKLYWPERDRIMQLLAKKSYEEAMWYGR